MNPVLDWFLAFLMVSPVLTGLAIGIAVLVSQHRQR